MIQIQLPEKVQFIISRLEQAGYEAYAVGGCVRDSLLGRQPHDWDVTTSAKPMQVKEVFRHTIDTGIQHGTVTVMLDHEGFEVTTYRIDGEYEDSRHPKEVTFTVSLVEDLKRRDFTSPPFIGSRPAGSRGDCAADAGCSTYILNMNGSLSRCLSRCWGIYVREQTGRGCC